MADASWNEAAVAEFTHDATQRAVEIVVDRIETEGRERMPVLDLGTTRPPGEGWSLPPGALQRSVSSRFGTDINGQAYGEVTADAVYRFTAKRRHKIRPALQEALDAQYGRAVP